LLAGKGGEADEAIVALNAGALLMTSGIAPDLHRGAAMALDSIRSGVAAGILERFIEASRG